jgi:hypothetical protein
MRADRWGRSHGALHVAMYPALLDVLKTKALDTSAYIEAGPLPSD